MAGRGSEAGSSIDKTARVLEAACAPGGPHRLAAIAEAAAVPKPTAHRILAALAAQGYLTGHGGGRYGAGVRMRALAAQVQADEPAGVEALLGALQRTAGHTVHFALRSGDTATYVHKIDADRPYRLASQVGMRLPLHSTAIGKCVLAHLRPAELETIIARGLPARTPATLTDPDRLRAELSRVRTQGYAIDDEENEATVRCIAAPVLGALGGVSVSTVTFLVSRTEIEALAPTLRDTATALGAALTG